MTKDEIVRSLNICADQVECRGCVLRDEKEFCEGKLMRIAAKVIESYAEKCRKNESAIQKLELDKETLEEMLEEKYTKKQLIQAVNDILEDTTSEDLHSTIQSVMTFLRLIDADGYFAFQMDGTAEIRLNEY